MIAYLSIVLIAISARSKTEVFGFLDTHYNYFTSTALQALAIFIAMESLSILAGADIYFVVVGCFGFGFAVLGGSILL